MAVPFSLYLSKLHFFPKPKQTQFCFTPKDPNFIFSTRKKGNFPAPIVSKSSQNLKNVAAILGFSGLAFTTLMVGSAAGSELAIMGSSFQFNEPSNALSLHTWASHVSSVVEWVTAMALVWKYGEKSGYESWKGLSWGMVPLLGGALCACTWHFFYNSECLELAHAQNSSNTSPSSCAAVRFPAPLARFVVVVALQAVLTVIGNATMCFAAFRIYRSSQKQSKKS